MARLFNRFSPIGVQENEDTVGVPIITEPTDAGFVERPDTTGDKGFNPPPPSPFDPQPVPLGGKREPILAGKTADGAGLHFGSPAPITASPIAPVQKTPIGNPKFQADQAELERLQKSGSGIDQILHPVDAQGNPDESKKPGFWKKLGSVAARIGDVAGTALFPTIAAQIPGTTMHHQLLVNRAAGRVANDLETEKEAKEIDQIGAPKPTEENWSVSPDFVGPNGEPVLVEQHSGQMKVQSLDPSGIKPKATNKVETPQQGYAKAIADAIQRGVDPLTDPHVMAWQTAIQNTQKKDEPKADDRARAIYGKDPNTWTDEEKAFIKGYEKQVNVTKTQPGVARMEVLMNGRPVQVVDPNNPDNVVYTTAGNAMRTGASSPQSVPFQTDKAMGRYMTSGAGGKQLTAFNTAITHLDTLERLAGDLGNSNIQIFNKAAQSWAEQTGRPAPANFAAAVNAMSGEVAAALKASGATDQEIAHVGATFSKIQSPAQLKGAINTYRELLTSKAEQLKKQYEQGVKGKPNFGGGGSFSVSAPNGKTYSFDSQEALDNFKKSAGIK